MASFGPDLDLSGVVANLAVLHPVVLSIEAKLRRTGKGKRLLIENGSKAEFNADLAAMITEAFAIRNQLLSGSRLPEFGKRIGGRSVCLADDPVRREPVSGQIPC
jgi:hypothetical protein